MIGRHGLALARFAIDLGAHHALGDACRHEQMVDPHPEVLVKMPCAIVPPSIAAGLAMP
jgi:hypothetical protein